MIRKFKQSDLPAVMQIWLEGNIKAHHFISEKYWTDNYEMVQNILPDAEVYVYEDEKTNQIGGFIGLTDDFVAGMFVKYDWQSQGIGKKLLDHVKMLKQELYLAVYQKNIGAIRFYEREQFVIEVSQKDGSTNESEFILRWRKKHCCTY